MIPQEAPTNNFNEVQSFYESRWRGKAYIGVYKQQRLAAIVRELSKLALREPRVLDAGCGSGWLASTLSNFGLTVGMDITPLALREAKGRTPRAEFVVADGCAMPFAPGAFDVVVSQEVLEHLVDKARYLAEIATCLRGGGYLLLTTPNGVLPDGMAIKEQPIEDHVKARELVDLLERSFRIVRLTTIIPCFSSNLNTHPLNWRILKRISCRLHLLSCLEWLQGKSLRSGHFLVVARKK